MSLPPFNGLTSPLWLPYAQMATIPVPIVAVRTEGCIIHLEDGRALIDGTASWWTACHGYNHPALLQAIQQQMMKMPHIMLGGIIHEQAWRLTDRLANLLPGDLNHTFLSDSGSVSVEVALKIARQYWVNLGKPAKNRLVHFKHGYHGDTLGAMSVGDPSDWMHMALADILPTQICCPLPETAEGWLELETTLAKQHDEIAAMIIEPLVQGAGGMKFYPPEALQKFRALCDHYSILLILDEIFTGFGRTGTFFAFEQAGIVPDIVCLGKALTGGVLTLASTTVRTPVYEAFLSKESLKAFMHGPTYMGNPLACAAANASLDLFEKEPRLEQVRSVSIQMSAELEPIKTFDCVLEVRVLGAIGVIEFYPDKMPNLTQLQQALIETGVWLRPFGHVLYVTPAFTITPAEISQLTRAIVQVLSSS